MSNKVNIRRLKTGVPGLDNLLGGGLPEFSFNLIAGTPGSGKTTLVHQIMFSLASPTSRALFFTVRFAQETYGVIPINFDDDDDEDPAEIILRATQNHGVDACIDAVGFEAKGSTLETALTNLKLEGSSGKALRQCIAATRRGGVISVPGIYADFIHGFLFGDAFDKGLILKMGQTHVQRFMPELLEHIGNGKMKPEVIITHRMKLADAEQGYEIFNNKAGGCRKVVLTP